MIDVILIIKHSNTCSDLCFPLSKGDADVLFVKNASDVFRVEAVIETGNAGWIVGRSKHAVAQLGDTISKSLSQCHGVRLDAAQSNLVNVAKSSI